MTSAQRGKKIERLRELLEEVPDDTTDQKRLALLLDSTRPVTQRMLDNTGRSRRDVKVDLPVRTSARTVEAYDSIQSSLPSDKQDGWLRKGWTRKVLHLNESLGEDEAIRKLIDIFLHSMPYMLFVSLPLFALILKLLYIRRRKEFFYADHGIFSIHHYVFSFIFLLTCMFLGWLEGKTDWVLWDILIFIALLAWPFHTYKAMRKFYGQRRFKTFIKFCLLNLLGFLMIALLMTIFGIISAFKL